MKVLQVLVIVTIIQATKSHMWKQLLDQKSNRLHSGNMGGYQWSVQEVRPAVNMQPQQPNPEIVVVEVVQTSQPIQNQNQYGQSSLHNAYNKPFIPVNNNYNNFEHHNVYPSGLWNNGGTGNNQAGPEQYEIIVYDSGDNKPQQIENWKHHNNIQNNKYPNTNNVYQQNYPTNLMSKNPGPDRIFEFFEYDKFGNIVPINLENSGQTLPNFSPSRPSEPTEHDKSHGSKQENSKENTKQMQENPIGSNSNIPTENEAINENKKKTSEQTDEAKKDEEEFSIDIRTGLDEEKKDSQ